MYINNNNKHQQGLVGAPACGDVMKLQIKVDDATGKIIESKFKTFGCGSAIASSSVATEWVKGKNVDDDWSKDQQANVPGFWDSDQYATDDLEHLYHREISGRYKCSKEQCGWRSLSRRVSHGYKLEEIVGTKDDEHQAKQASNGGRN